MIIGMVARGCCPVSRSWSVGVVLSMVGEVVAWTAIGWRRCLGGDGECWVGGEVGGGGECGGAGE